MRIVRLISIAAIAAATACGAPPPQGERAEGPADPSATNALPPLRDTVRTAERADLLPPGAVIGGDSPSGEAETIVFDSRDPPSRLLAWYRSGEREFRLGSELREGAEYVLSGSTRAPDRDFTVRLAPHPNGGTSGFLLLTDR